MEKERHVRKSNIFVEGRYRFGVNEQRILLSIISKIKLSDTEFQPYRLQWNYLKKITNNRYKSSEDLNQACQRLKNKTVIIDDDGKQHGFGFLSGWTIDPGKWVEFRIDPCMKSMLLDLIEGGKFTLYKLECILALGSAYSIRLYELLKSLEWKYQPVEIPLNKLRWTLGVEAGSLAERRFDIFKSKILDKAQRDLAKHTDIKFTYRKILELRKVVALQVTISENKKYQTTIASHTGKTEIARDGDKVLLDGKEYTVEGDCIRLSDGPMPIGYLNQLVKKGVAKKL